MYLSIRTCLAEGTAVYLFVKKCVSKHLNLSCTWYGYQPLYQEVFKEVFVLELEHVPQRRLLCTFLSEVCILVLENIPYRLLLPTSSQEVFILVLEHVPHRVLLSISLSRSIYLGISTYNAEGTAVYHFVKKYVSWY